jgi:hypothetical protein
LKKNKKELPKLEALFYFSRQCSRCRLADLFLQPIAAVPTRSEQGEKQ